MKTLLFVLILCFCSIQMFYSQEDDGVVSLSLPMRNSLTFNRYVINPTFSFVREQNKYISISNKREWVDFENAPLTYLASYSGRFGENIGAGLGLFQQNYGVLTTFGGNLNFAYNARLARDSNLTFGLNIGAYKSGVNTGNVVTNFDDPSLQNVPENFLLTVNPGINYGTGFIDFGVSINNLALYNFQNSTLIENNPEQGIQAHVMYTGYMMSTRGFFDESKFTGLVKSEFKKEETILSAMAMLTVPKGIWAQVGYNSVYGIHGGLGINITSQIALEYNYEMATGDLSNFGNSHDFTLAYRFKNRDRYNYSGDDEVSGLLISDKKKTKVAKVSKPNTKKVEPVVSSESEADVAEQLAEAQRLKEQQEAEANAKLLAEQKAKQEAEAKANTIQLAKEKANKDAEAARNKRLAQEEADTQAKLLADQKAKEQARANQLAEEQKLKAQEEARAKLQAEQNAKRLAEERERQEAEAKAKLLAQELAQQEAVAQAKLLEEQKAKEAADAEAQILAEQKAKEEALLQARLAAEQKAKDDAEAQAKLLAEEQAKEELISNPKDDISKAMYAITQETEDSKTEQAELLKRFDDIVEIKNNDLKDLKEENDLSEQGITVDPKPFKSITEENNRLANIKSELDDVIASRNEKIKDLKALYEDKFDSDTLVNDDVYLYYQKALKRLESEQLKATKAKTVLETRLADIKVATEFERRRRIKKAAFDNEEDRYAQDRAALQNIKQITSLSNTALTEDDFDFGQQQSDNIQILENVPNVDNGYYLIVAVHTDVTKRNEFVKNVVASGREDVDFFYDVKTSKYYIYYDKFESIEQANEALKAKGNRPYNKKMSLVKIEN
ncbi:PorP/SprF family type IX secretion system membrane protein [Psychroserpens sp. Hel_I_66]|uniref:PorP/SprF family type IX secretion system membrane protein n=1 Tax=Psychroserpens sp. Hel_I_66 TaxID=1250004 RepID=UPI000646D650|nr:PorP/SprF family type IX secretion system membrane protein [Psychroserpens sp. Hel_I_66]